MRLLCFFIWALVLLLPTSGWAAFSVVDHVADKSGIGGSFTSAAMNSTGATGLVCGLTSYDLATEPTLSDSKGNTFTPLTVINITNLLRVRLLYVAAPSVGSGHTFTVTISGGNSYSSVACLALSGMHATPFDQENGTPITPAATSAQPGSVTPSVDNEILITVMGFDDGESSATIDSSFTISDQINANYYWWGIALAYKIQTTAGAENPTWSWTGSTRAVSAIASFKAAAAGTDQTFGFLKRRAR